MGNENWMLWIALGFIIGTVWWILVYELDLQEDVQLSQETINEVCRQITINESAIGKDDGWGKLVCILPSFDATQNILIKSNTEE